MTDKTKFKRDTIHDTKIRLVMIRLDYICYCTFSKLRSLFEDNFGSNYSKNIEKIEFRSKDFIDSISKNLKIPVEDIEDMPVVRYKSDKQGNCLVTLDLSQCYLGLTIKCKNNYDGLDKYIKPIKGFLSILYKKGIFFNLKRIGVRKIRTEDFYSFDNLASVFEPFMYNTPQFGVDRITNLKCEYKDVFEDKNNSLRSNICRAIERQLDLDGNEMLCTTLDIDVYKHLDEVGKIGIRDLLDVVNEKEFKLYIECMTYDYLNSIYGK